MAQQAAKPVFNNVSPCSLAAMFDPGENKSVLRLGKHNLPVRVPGALHPRRVWVNYDQGYSISFLKGPGLRGPYILKLTWRVTF